jgi:hypothetical protein
VNFPPHETESVVTAAAATTLPNSAAHVAMRGTDVGVSVRTTEDALQYECLLGSRRGDEMLVWSPNWRLIQPCELTCDPQTALDRQGTEPPH